jgi:hypothetical protein
MYVPDVRGPDLSPWRDAAVPFAERSGDSAAAGTRGRYCGGRVPAWRGRTRRGGGPLMNILPFGRTFG